MWRIHTVLMATVAFLVLSACSNITNSDPAASGDPATDPKSLTAQPTVAIPGGYTGAGVVEIQSGSLSAPERIEDHFVPIGPVWDVTVDGRDHVDFGDEVATLRFVYNEAEARWERLKESVPVQEAGNHYIQAETHHFSSFVATAVMADGNEQLDLRPDPGAPGSRRVALRKGCCYQR
jgi:hypothetical protein